jgi:SAM-dependent methyltransferase
MGRVPTSNETAGSAIVYAGRFADRVAEAGLPGGYAVLSEWEVLPAKLVADIEGATALVVLDPFSFPFEIMTGEQWGVPLIVVLPAGFDVEFLIAVFGEVVFGRLTLFDRVATADEGAWEVLRRRYGWAGSQRVALESDAPDDAAAEIGALLEAENATPAPLVDGAPRGAGPEKAIHLAEKAVLEPQFADAWGDRADDVAFDVLEVGAGTGRWAASFDLARTRFFGVDIDGNLVAAARANVLGASFEHLGPDLILPYQNESFDLVFSVTVMHHHPTPAKKTLLSEMWRVARPGGRLLFLEEFVSDRSEEAVYPMSVNVFVALLLEATNEQVVLEHMESLRYPREDLTRGGVIAVSRLGVPKKW